MAQQPLLGNHQRCWVWGRNAVLATLRAGRWRPYELRFGPDIAGDVLSEVRSLCGNLDIPLVESSAGDLLKLSHGESHQGLAVKMPPFPYADIETIDGDLVVATDGVQDAHNFGAIVRSAEAFGAAGVVIPAAGQAGVTSQVARSSAGAVNGVPIAKVDGLPAFLKTCRSQGRQVFGASERGAVALDEIGTKKPAVLVIGNEGAGLSDAVLDLCDARVAIPMTGLVGSLNAAVAAGILIYHFTQP